MDERMEDARGSGSLDGLSVKASPCLRDNCFRTEDPGRLDLRRDFQPAYNVRIFCGEFSAIRWASCAADYLRDCSDVFEENGWDWTYHAFREWDGWSVEHVGGPQDHQPAK